MAGLNPGITAATTLDGDETIRLDTGNTQGVNPAVATATPDLLALHAPASVAVAYAATVTLDLSAGKVFRIAELTGNVTIANRS